MLQQFVCKFDYCYNCEIVVDLIVLLMVFLMLKLQIHFVSIFYSMVMIGMAVYAMCREVGGGVDYV